MTRSVFSDAYELFLELMVETRKDAGLNQTELAERIGWDQPKISTAENGIRRVDVIEFIAICRALDIEPASLIDTLSKRLPNELDI